MASWSALSSPTGKVFARLENHGTALIVNKFDEERSLARMALHGFENIGKIGLGKLPASQA